MQCSAKLTDNFLMKLFRTSNIDIVTVTVAVLFRAPK